MNYATNGVLTGWSGTDIKAIPKYNGVIHIQGDTLYVSTALYLNNDTAIVETNHKIGKRTETHIAVHGKDSLIFAERKLYTYKPTGEIISCQYIEGRHEGTISAYTIVTTDEQGNITWLNEYWPDNNKLCRIIEYIYEYY